LFYFVVSISYQFCNNFIFCYFYFVYFDVFLKFLYYFNIAHFKVFAKLLKYQIWYFITMLRIYIYITFMRKVIRNLWNFELPNSCSWNFSYDGMQHNHFLDKAMSSDMNIFSTFAYFINFYHSSLLWTVTMSWVCRWVYSVFISFTLSTFREFANAYTSHGNVNYTSKMFHRLD